jgi:hypothetical protein
MEREGEGESEGRVRVAHADALNARPGHPSPLSLPLPSSYLDNSSMELYHGRLDKRPGAIAVRVRWYGEGQPRLAFVERKTHRESWKGEESVKERFTLAEPCVVPFLEGRYTPADAAEDLRAKGKSEADVAKFVELVRWGRGGRRSGAEVGGGGRGRRSGAEAARARRARGLAAAAAAAGLGRAQSLARP